MGTAGVCGEEHTSSEEDGCTTDGWGEVLASGVVCDGEKWIGLKSDTISDERSGETVSTLGVSSI